MEIDPKFSTWLAKAKITPGSATIPQWWEAIDDFTADRADVVQLALVARKQAPTADFEDKFVKALQTADPSFVKADRVALAVLAGAKLHNILKHDAGPMGKFTELLVAATYPATANHPAYLTDMVTLAHEWIADSSQERANWEYLKTGDSALEEGEEATDALRKIAAASAEETNMLWWIFGETSRDLDQKFGDIDEGALALLAGSELADLTLALPGPVAMIAFANRACRTGRAKPASDIEVSKAVTALPIEWRKAFAAKWASMPFRSICPVANAITASVEGTAAKWPARFTEASSWPKNHRMAPARLARQFYLECLVSKSWTLAKP